MIIYFTGTGNSQYVADKLAAATGDTSLNLFERIRNRDYSPMDSAKPWVLVCPAYAWRVPRLLEDWLRKAHFTGSNQLYFVMTCGDSIAGAGKYAEELCNEMGMTYMGIVPVVMPENYVAMFPVPDRDESVKIIEAAEQSISEAAACISKTEPFRTGNGSKLMSSIINGVFYTFLVKDKKFYTTDACTGCGHCETVCPLRNITVTDGTVKWNGNCTHCMACICKCPQEAIEYGKASLGKWRYQCPTR